MRYQSFCKDAIADCKRVGNEFILCAKDIQVETFNEAWEFYRKRHPTLSSSSLKTRHTSLRIVFRFAVNKEYPVHQLSSSQLKLEIHSKGLLDLYDLQNRMDEFLSLLSAEGYSVGKRSTLRTSIGRIIIQARTIKWDTFQEIRDWYDNQELSDHYRFHVRETIDKIECFMTNGTITPHPSIQNKMVEKSPTDRLSIARRAPSGSARHVRWFCKRSSLMISLPAIELVVEEQHRDVCESGLPILPSSCLLFLTFCNQQIVDLLHSVGRIDQARPFRRRP